MLKSGLHCDNPPFRNIRLALCKFAHPAHTRHQSNRKINHQDSAEISPAADAFPVPHPSEKVPALRSIIPYWYRFRVSARGQWFGRTILDVAMNELSFRPEIFYRHALRQGITTINGKIVTPGTVVRNGDIIENTVHRHEPAVTASPVEILHHDTERQFLVVNKPASIPVHPIRQYFKNSLVEILKDQFGFSNVYLANRLDRLTSGAMFFGLSPQRAREISLELRDRLVHKEYIARVKGQFPASETLCKEPLMQVERHVGLDAVRCHPAGKPAETLFKLVSYDANSDTSVVHCTPLTGRQHQIRAHLQYLGHPIANDWLYSDEGMELSRPARPAPTTSSLWSDKQPPKRPVTFKENVSWIDIVDRAKAASTALRQWDLDHGHRNEPSNLFYVNGVVIPPSSAMQLVSVRSGSDDARHQYCSECNGWSKPDPRPESLHIFLHALRYKTSLGTFETDMPEWAAEGFEWRQPAMKG